MPLHISWLVEKHHSRLKPGMNYISNVILVYLFEFNTNPNFVQLNYSKSTHHKFVTEFLLPDFLGCDCYQLMN